jgi:hypothetical protein
MVLAGVFLPICLSCTCIFLYGFCISPTLLLRRLVCIERTSMTESSSISSQLSSEELERRRIRIGEGSVAGAVAGFLILAQTSPLNVWQVVAVALFGLGIPIGILCVLIGWDDVARTKNGDTLSRLGLHLLLTSAMCTLAGYCFMFFGIRLMLGFLFASCIIICSITLGHVIAARDKRTTSESTSTPK